MKSLIANKNLLVSIVVILLLLAGGYWYVNNSTPDNSAVLSASAPAASDTLLSTLTELRSLTLDSSLFTSPAFMSLNDNTVTLPTVASGRPNPFAGLPSLLAAAAAQQQANTTTGH